MRKEYRYGKKVRQLREERGWTQEHLAAVAGIESVRTVQRVEKGETKNLETLQAIANGFDVELAALRDTWRIAESRLVRTWLVTNHRQFVQGEESQRWQMSSSNTLAGLTEGGLTQVEGLLKQIFADREYIEPDETDLWDSWIKQTEEPLQAIFDLGLQLFMLDECRDWLLPTIGEMKPLKDHMVCHVKHLMVVPKHGCFMVNDAEPLHCFSSSCSGAGEVLFNAVKGKFPTVQVYPDALWTAFHPGGEFSLRWCDNCFPPLLGGARITFEYIEKVTGLNRIQLHALCEAITGQPFLEGLA